jgi:PAS domain S-box-containing protein
MAPQTTDRLPAWQSWPQLVLLGAGMFLAVLLWTGLSMQWVGQYRDRGWEAEATRVAARVEDALADSQRRVASIASLLSQLQTTETRPGTRTTLEAALRRALTGAAGDFDGVTIFDGAGRRLLVVGEAAEAAEALLRGATVPGLVWHEGALMLAGRWTASTERPAGAYLATLRPAALGDALRGEVVQVALMLADDTLVALAADGARMLRRGAPATGTPTAAPPAAGQALDHAVTAPLPAVAASLVIRPHDEDDLRRYLLLSGGALAGLLLAALLLLLLWIDRRLRRSDARHVLATDHARDRALRSIKDMLGALPATLYRAEIFADRSIAFTSVSENVERMTGLSSAEIIRPDAWRDHVHPADLSALAQHLDTLYRDGESSTEYRFRHGDGRTIWLREQARIVAAGQHGGADVMGYLADISSERLLQVQTLASAKLATLGRMASSLAHEMTQPISVMMLAAENALDAHEHEGPAAVGIMAAKLGRILEQTRRAQSLVEHLRVFGRTDEGRTEAVDLAGAVEGALLLCSSVLSRAGVTVEEMVPRRLPPVAANPVMLEQVIVNLMLNARDAMQRIPEAERRLVVRAQELPDRRVELQISDHGRGLSPEALARLFEPFFTTKAPGQGMGLGLSICHGIIRSFGGEITGGNGPHGAVFTIRLPAAGEAGHGTGNPDASAPDAPSPDARQPMEGSKHAV